jgi:hypothetical protein
MSTPHESYAAPRRGRMSALVRNVHYISARVTTLTVSLERQDAEDALSMEEELGTDGT